MTITLDVMLAFFAGIVWLMSQFAAGLAHDVCAPGECGMVPLGRVLFSYGPLLCLLAAVAGSIVLLVRRQMAWWVPAIGFGAVFVVWTAGATLIQP
ncbi:hypothetical protein [Microbacterium sp. 22242]|uniref:hypothetical protein n=1 Tax=Microbacterium sp. 22242 TaxID=3453896 RepID=UPI003F856953